jgi:hypothetical protein
MEGPAYILVMRDAGEYAKYLRRDDVSAPIRSGGHFEPWSNRIVVYMSQEDTQREVLFHEGTHQIVAWAMRGAPGAGGRQGLWFSEGIAEYFGGNRVDYVGKQPVYIPGLLLPKSIDDCADAKERGDLLPLEEVLNYKRSDFNRDNEIAIMARKVKNAYAQGWALCYFLQEHAKDKYREKFVEYAKGEFEGKSGLTYFKRVFGDSALATIEVEYTQMIVELKAAKDAGKIVNGRLTK